MVIPFNRPFRTGLEGRYISEAIASGRLSGDGPFTRRCTEWLERSIGCSKVLLTHSCTAALEMASILAGVGPGDEVIMPSYTFVSTANAVVLRGGIPVFVDIQPDTLNIDESLIENAITSRTRSISPVHYAGVACDMDAIMGIARRHGLVVAEDAAQGIGATYKGKPLGTIGQLGCISFHETKNVISGEGGALLVNDPALHERAEIIREKGTDRSRFLLGQVDKYSWVDIGSSYLPSELVAAFLLAQLEQSDEINRRRGEIWNRYHEAFAELEKAGKLHRPVVPDNVVHNAHIYYVLVRDLATRTRVIDRLKKRGVGTVFHYVPLHSSPAGRRFGRIASAMAVTESIADRLLRLPLWPDMSDDVSTIIAAAIDTVHEVCG